ncbi:hypothetical protein BC832DRAFT_158032 [Gaertneriomyces semiglobifer]|nr:hypothetical protein BC832DRAFT_158032 [Gaertneriomyces semiglobifer]
MPRNTDAKGRDHGVRENGAHASGGEAATDSEKNDGKQSRTKSVLSRYGGSSSARGLITESWEPLSAKNTSTNIRPSWAPSEENSTITQGSILRATAERDPIADAYTHADATSANSGTVIAPSPLSQAAQQDENCGTVVPFSPLTQAAQEEAFVDPTFFSAQKRTSTEATIVRENSLTDLSRRQTITRDHVESNPPERRRREDSTWTPDASAAKRNTYHKSCEQLGSSLNGMPETVVRSASDISVKVSATGVGVRKMSIVIPEKPILDSQSKPRSASPAHGQFRHMRNPSEAPTTPITPVTPTSATSPNTRDASAPNVLAPFKGDVSFHDRLQWLKDRLDSSMNASSSVSSQRSAANSRTTSSGYTGFPGESRVAQADAFAGYNPALGGATPPRMYRTTSSRTGHNSPGTARKTPMLTVTVPAEGPPSAARTPLDVRGANLTNALGAELPGLTFSPFVVHPTIEVPWTNNYNNAQGSASAVHAQYAFPKPPAPTPVENTPSGSQTYSLDRDYFGYRRSGVHTPKVPSSPYQPTLAQRRKQTPTGVPSTSGTVAVFVHAEDDTCNIFTLPPNTTMNEVKLEALSKMGFVETFESFNMYCMEMAANGETIETRIDPNTPLEHLVPLLPASKLTHPDGTKSEPPSRDSSLSRMNALPPSVKVRLRRKSLPRFTLPVQIDTSIPARARYVLVDQMMKVEDVIQVIALVEGVEMDDEEDTGSICANWGLWREDSSSNLRYLQPSEMPFDPFERKFKYYFRRHQPRRAAKLSNWLGISADMEQVQRLVNQEASAAQDVKRRNDARKSQKLSHILGIDDTTANVSVGNSAGSNGLAKVSEREKEKNKEKDSDSGTFSGTLKRSRQFLSLRKKYPSEADLPDRTATESQPLERTENSVKAQPLSRSLQSVSKSTGDITKRGSPGSERAS